MFTDAHSHQFALYHIRLRPFQLRKGVMSRIARYNMEKNKLTKADQEAARYVNSSVG
ncbi:MAG: hypothetical protein ACXV4C_08995 [Halobacteriota archaeon]